MNYFIAADTDIGIKKSTNQDGLSVKLLKKNGENMVFAVLCDGMGGLAKGELASTELIKAFDNWLENDFSGECHEQKDFEQIKSQWSCLVDAQNRKIGMYGRQSAINLGTTVVVLLLTDNGYLAMNVGDSRAYEIGTDIAQITKDQTVVAQEIEMGKLTKEEALKDSRRNVLLQCVGASETVVPAFYQGATQLNHTYLLCSDGFVHEISDNEIYEKLAPQMVNDKIALLNNIRNLIELNKSRLEQDNISVVAVKTY
ncbi:MAG: serine/threonine-protein phosphatase [Clostridia bacterium]|nr:serine/threonine-protein phosphatase [Clostridia bacterium]MBQ7120849.1 serine/threonine-protein phosphatase [Clostridia bacterium]